MARISTAMYNRHEQALKLLEKDVLTHDEKLFVLTHYHEGATNNNGKAGAFFTPPELAKQFSIHAPTPNTTRKVRIIDLCAGIGSLAFHMKQAYEFGVEEVELVCIEQNPEYLEVGKKIVPSATWIQGDVNDLDLILSLGRFDFAMSNPPFGSVATFKNAEKMLYTGSDATFKVIEIASLLAPVACFIMQQASCGFKYSGVDYFTKTDCEPLEKFTEQTGIELGPTNFSGTDEFQREWKSKVPVVEFVETFFDGCRSLEFINRKRSEVQLNLLSEVA